MYKFNTGVAWLSSVRAVRCRVNFLNERNSYFILKHIIRNN